MKRAGGFQMIQMNYGVRLTALFSIGWFCQIATPASAIEWWVTANFDAPDSDVGNGQCDIEGYPASVCTLRAAIQEANAAGGGTIHLYSPGTHYLREEGQAEDQSQTGDLDITSDILVEGAPAAPWLYKIDGTDTDRIFHVHDGGHLHLVGVMVQNGRLASACPSDCGGGGIRVVEGGRLTVEDSRIFGNDTVSGSGGGIAASQGTTTIIRRSWISNNIATGDVGGIWSSGVLEIHDTSIFENAARNFASGGVSATGTLTITGSSIYDNNAGTRGGGISLSSAEATIENSTISGNRAGSGSGGGIYSHLSTLHLSSVTISINRSSSAGAGLYLGNLQISGGDLLTGDVYIQNSILANNHSGVPNIYPSDCNGGLYLHSEGYNLFGSVGSCDFDLATGDVSGVVPGLGPLDDNGGPTWTHLPLEDSPVIDAGNPIECGRSGSIVVVELLDQRGKPRIADGDGNGSVICDIGAVEVEHVPEPVGGLAMLVTLAWLRGLVRGPA